MSRERVPGARLRSQGELWDIAAQLVEVAAAAPSGELAFTSCVDRLSQYDGLTMQMVAGLLATVLGHTDEAACARMRTAADRLILHEMWAAPAREVDGDG